MSLPIRLFMIFRNPKTWVLIGIIAIALEALCRLFATLGPALVAGSIAFLNPSFSQRLFGGLSLYVQSAASMFHTSPVNVWFRITYSVAYAGCSLVIAWFLWQLRSWARYTLFILLAVDLLRYVVASITGWTVVVDFAINALAYIGIRIFDFAAYYGLVVFIFSRQPVISLFAPARFS